jgi:hypothetical protein
MWAAALGLALAVVTSWHGSHVVVYAVVTQDKKVEEDRWRNDSIDGISPSPYMMVR